MNICFGLRCIPLVLSLICTFFATTTNSWSKPVARRRVVPQIILSSVTALFLPGVPTAQARNLPENNGADLANVGTIQALLPIITMEQDLLKLQSSIRTINSIPLQPLLLPPSIPTKEQQFKQIFDSYSIPVSYMQQFRNNNAFLVYYTQGYDGPNRSNIETLTDNELLQQAQYGARNECWLAWNEFLSEVNYYSKTASSGTAAAAVALEDESISELSALLQTTIRAIDAYIQLAPNQEEARAKWKDV